MVQNVNPTFVKTPNASITIISTGTTGATATLYTGGASGTKISSIVITANTSSTQDVRLAVVSSASIGYFNTVSVSTNAGLASATSPVNGLANAPLALDSDGNPFLFLASSAQSLNAFLTTNSSIWTSGNVINIVVTAGDF